MSQKFSATILTLFPEMFPGTLGHSLAGTALKKGLWSLETLNIRDFTTDKHRTVDSPPYGGGDGMVLRPDIIHEAVIAAKARQPDARLIYTSPRGRRFDQSLARELATQQMIILCGRFEGVDQRVIDHHQMEEISLGDFVLSGGEPAAIAMLDAVVRLIPGVMGKHGSASEESFGLSEDYARLIEHSQYTRPPLWMGYSVPETLLSGTHEQIKHWRLEQARDLTRTRRPDLVRDKKEE